MFRKERVGDIALCYFDQKWSRLGKNTHINLKKTKMKKKYDFIKMLFINLNAV
jgi:hypothetical protein